MPNLYASDMATNAEGVRTEIGQIPAIEGLRGVAVLSVVLFHYITVRGGMPNDPWVNVFTASQVLENIVRHGWLGLELFFLLTGFLLTLTWFKHAAEGRGRPSTREFWRRRVRRIVPAYYVQLVILFFVVLPLLLGTHFWAQHTQVAVVNLLAHLSFLQYTSPVTSASLTINGALWTLSLEAQYYLVLPLLAPFFVWRPVLATVLFVLLAVAWRYAAMHDLAPLVALEMHLGSLWEIPESKIRNLIATQLPGYMGHFALGIFAGYAWMRAAALGANRRRDILAAVACVLVLGLLYWTEIKGPEILGEFNWLLSLGCLAAILVASVSLRPAWGEVLLGNRPLRFFGRVSYSMYLYHIPLVLLMHVRIPSQDTWLAFPAYFAVLVGVSCISYRYVELPYMGGPGR
jgi:peptidoglycan/LPS O-acetylase OafA/YrhL